MSNQSDRVENQIVIEAPRAQVWRALASSAEFGSWFGAKFEEDFAAGKPVTGKMPKPGHDSMAMELVIEKVEPEALFSYRWHPYAIDPEMDYSAEPMTLVEFHLEAKGASTAVRLSESGFDGIPETRRAEAHKMHSMGWEHQLANLARHVTES